MARGFTRRKGASRGEPVIVAHLDAHERELVISLLTDVHHILKPGASVINAPELPADPFEALMVQAGLADGSEVDADPAMKRLVPDGHAQDAQVSADFRALNGPGLREAKAARIELACAALRAAAAGAPKVELSGEQAQALLVALTDVRLVLAQRLELENDADVDALDQELSDALSGPGVDTDTLDPQLRQRLMRAAYYDFITWMQESLVAAVTRGW